MRDSILKLSSFMKLPLRYLPRNYDLLLAIKFLVNLMLFPEIVMCPNHI